MELGEDIYEINHELLGSISEFLNSCSQIEPQLSHLVVGELLRYQNLGCSLDKSMLRDALHAQN